VNGIKLLNCTRALRVAECHLVATTPSILNLGDWTVRVFSDGVPERDYPGGCQLAVLSDRKVTRQDLETKGSVRRADAETPSGCEA